MRDGTACGRGYRRDSSVHGRVAQQRLDHGTIFQTWGDGVKVTVIEQINPFLVSDQKRYELDHVSGIAQIIERKGLDFQSPTICTVNGQAVMRKDWHSAILKHEYVVCFVAQPQGPAAAAVAAWGFSEWATAVLVVSSIAAGIMLRPPEIGDTPEPDPMFSLSGQNNQIKLNNPIEVPYGRNKIWPSYAARPFTRYIDNDQYLYQLLCVGQGKYDVEGVFIEDTSIDSFGETIDYEVYEPGQSPDLFASNVTTSVEVSNIELLGTEVYTRQISGITQANPAVITTSTPHGFTVGNDMVVTGVVGMSEINGIVAEILSVTSTTITVDIDSSGFSPYSSLGVDKVYEFHWTGPFVANSSGSDAIQLEVDMIHPTGVYYRDSKGGTWSQYSSCLFQYREIDDAGSPVGDWETLYNYAQDSYSINPLRLTFSATVPAGRYEVRARRTNQDSQSSKDQDTIVWGGLRAVLLDNTDYGNVTLLAIKAKATNNLNSSSSNRVGVIATRKLPIYGGESWSAETATRNPVWAFCDAVRAEYGARLSDSYLDLETLTAIAADLDEEGISFDWVFDQRSALWETLSTICRVAYASPTMYGSVLSMVRDKLRTIPTALFNQENIVKNSLQWNVRLFELGEYDSVEIEYIDSTTWKQETVIASVDGSDEINPEKTTLAGCTDRDKAYQYGLYLAAAKRYRREAITFQTGKEGLIPTFGDLISISHDVPRWGSGGYVVDIDGLIITTSEPCVFADGNHYIVLRKKDGSATEPLLVTAGDDQYHVVLDAPLTDEFYLDDINEPPFYHFGKADKWAELAIVTSTRPQGNTVEIQSIPYDARVYPTGTEESPALGEPNGSTDPDLPEVTGLQVISLPQTISHVLVSWNVAPGAKQYILQKKSADAENWQDVIATTNTSYVLNVEKIHLYLRVAAVNVGMGSWDTWEGDVGEPVGIPDDIDNLDIVGEFIGTSVSWDWDSVATATAYKVEIRQDGGAALMRTAIVSAPAYTYRYADAVEDGAISRNLQIRVYAKNDFGDSEGYELDNASNPIPAIPTGFAFDYSSENNTHVFYTFHWDANVEADIAAYRIFGSASTGFTPGGGNLLATVTDLTATVQLAKTAIVKTITGVTQANPCVLTTAGADDVAAGDFVTMAGVVGMTELNGNTYEVLSVTSTTLTIDVNASGFTAYVSGGTATTTNVYASTYYFRLSARDVWGDDINACAEITVSV